MRTQDAKRTFRHIAEIPCCADHYKMAARFETGLTAKVSKSKAHVLEVGVDLINPTFNYQNLLL